MFATISKLLKWADGYHKRIYLGVVCSFLQTWCTSVPIITAAWMLNHVIENENGNEIMTISTVIVGFVVILVSVLLRFLFSYWKAVLQESIGTELCAKERIQIGDILKRVSLGYFSEKNTGEILSSVTNEMSQLELQATKMIDAVMNGYANLLAIITCITIFCWQAGLVALVGSIISFLLLTNMNRYSNRTAPISNKATESLSSSILEYVKGLQVVKSYGQQGAAIKNFRNSCKDSKDIHIKINQDFTPRNCLHMFVLKATAVGIIFIATLFAYEGTLEISYFIMICMFAFMMFGSIEALTDSSHVLGVLDKVLIKLEQIKNVSYIDEGSSDVIVNKYDIRFDSVSFAYEKKSVLKDLSFIIPEKSSTAIIGPSGSGKTTICSLIARFYDVDHGSIKIGGNDIREFTCDSLLKNISMVFQNVYLFRDTIYNNIKFGKPDATKEDIIEAAKKAQCHEFIMSLPNGYDTLVGEGGSSLSGGGKTTYFHCQSYDEGCPNHYS